LPRRPTFLLQEKQREASSSRLGSYRLGGGSLPFSEHSECAGEQSTSFGFFEHEEHRNSRVAQP
jgi:hypothetical protein